MRAPLVAVSVPVVEVPATLWQRVVAFVRRLVK
jgi:hypothetical protein